MHYVWLYLAVGIVWSFLVPISSKTYVAGVAHCLALQWLWPLSMIKLVITGKP